MFSANYIFLLNITYVFAIITCLGFLVIYAYSINCIYIIRLIVADENVIYLMREKSSE